MRCHDAQEALTAARYEGVEPSAETAAHLAGCAACAAFAKESAELDGVLAADVEVELRPGFDTRFRARLEEQKARGRRRVAGWPRLTALAFGTALTAALAVFVVAERRPHVTPEPTPTDLAIAMNLELLEDMDVVARLDEVEVLDLMNHAGPDALDAALRETRSVQ